ncbi:DUF1902 domain-containing protein [Jiella sonneratiae]|uniref:DUF1902 domain-containing protein n=1 Tax=Jiella sonneratiae TaxID=2816856 RepID=A0ABS3J189_9HYPH|nr:DUF1902 domain-containing protein [Jiella sonneratiae]MBO0903451.1 DUF1902 domain-containing protein [Jiella sonneratiae]
MPDPALYIMPAVAVILSLGAYAYFWLTTPEARQDLDSDVAFDVDLVRDEEADVWTAANEAIPIAVEAPSYQQLLDDVRLISRDLARLNLQSDQVKIRFHVR